MPGVTISAGYGAGGSVIAPEVARLLGIPLLDRTISSHVAEQLQVSVHEAESGAIRRSLGAETMRITTQALRDSIQHALDNRPAALEYAMQFARDLDTSLANKFVGMYVNERTLNYGDDGREAIKRLLGMGYERGVIPTKANVDFID